MTQAIIAIVAVILIMGIISYLLGFKEWLKWAVAEAEKQYGSGTGQLKLHKVYDMAVSKWGIVSKILPFIVFSKMVDYALKWLNKQITDNSNIAMIIEKGE